MKTNDYSTSFTVEQTPEEAFAAINNIRGWWSGEMKVVPTSSAMSLLIVINRTITANRRSQNSFLAKKSLGWF